MIGDQIDTIEGLLHHSINYISRFLDNQVDYAVVRNQAIQKAYKQELIDKQNEEINGEKNKITPLSLSFFFLIKTVISCLKTFAFIWHFFFHNLDFSITFVFQNWIMVMSFTLFLITL